MQGILGFVDIRRKEIEGNEKKSRKSERQEILNYFYEKLLPLWKGKNKFSARWLGMNTNHLKTNDLYYIKSICLDVERRGGSFSKTFWGSLKVKGAK